MYIFLYFSMNAVYFWKYNLKLIKLLLTYVYVDNFIAAKNNSSVQNMKSVLTEGCPRKILNLKVLRSKN